MKPKVVLTKEEMLAKQEEIRQHNRKVAREASWLCELFQEAELCFEEKEKILKDVIKDFKKSKDLVRV